MSEPLPDLTDNGKKPWFRKERRAVPFAADKEKFSTQRAVTYVLLLIFAGVSGWVMWGSDQSERSMVLQTIINLTLLAVGYWLGSSKTGTDQAQSMSRMAEAAAPVAAAAVAAATGQPIPGLQPLPVANGTTTTTDQMQVSADTVNVTETPATPTKICPNAACAMPNPPDANFCRNCGTKLG